MPYNITGWLEKNKDPLNDTVVDQFKKGTNKLVGEIFADHPGQSGGGKDDAGGKGTDSRSRSWTMATFIIIISYSIYNSTWNQMKILSNEMVEHYQKRFFDHDYLFELTILQSPWPHKHNLSGSPVSTDKPWCWFKSCFVWFTFDHGFLRTSTYRKRIHYLELTIFVNPTTYLRRWRGPFRTSGGKRTKGSGFQTVSALYRVNLIFG